LKFLVFSEILFFVFFENFGAFQKIWVRAVSLISKPSLTVWREVREKVKISGFFWNFLDFMILEIAIFYFGDQKKSGKFQKYPAARDGDRPPLLRPLKWSELFFPELFWNFLNFLFLEREKFL